MNGQILTPNSARPFMLRRCSARTAWREKPFREVILGKILNVPEFRVARGFTLVELLIVMVLVGVMGSMAVLAMGQADPGRLVQLEAQRLARLLELAEQEASIRGEAVGIELYAGGYRFLQTQGNGWQAMNDALFQSRTLSAPLHLALTLNGEVASLPFKPDYQPKPQIVLTPDGDSEVFRIAFDDGNASRYWLDNGADGGLQVGSDEAGER